MHDWNESTLSEYDKKIVVLAKEAGLDWYEIIYEIVDYYTMIGTMACHGMPALYNHWSRGKAFEVTHQMYNAGVEGLPYELIINSDPSIAYLMRENPLALQILIMSHCIGHSDFFKNNRMFKNTRADTVFGRFRSAKKRIQGYVEDPSIGIEKVEKLIDAAHTVQFQIDRNSRKRETHKELLESLTKQIREQTDDERPIFFDLERIPLQPDYDILGFVLDHRKNLHSWERDVIEIIRDEASYFWPQIQTKIMNEGWASTWHYRLSHKLNLPDEFHLSILKSHNQVLKPSTGGINPYHLGFYLFNKIEERHGINECFIARETCNDVSFLRTYLTEEDCRELNLFSYSTKPKDEGVTIDEISDEDGWKKAKETLIQSVSGGSIPVIYVDEVEQNGTLILRHEYDGRSLDINHAEKVVSHVKHLWNDKVKLFTVLEEELWEI